MIAANTASSYLELSQRELHRNIEFIRSLIKPSTILSAVVKGNAYGHGLKQMIPLMEAEGITHFSVYGAEEALEFQRAARPQSDLMIMGYIDKENLPWIIEQGYSFFVYNLDQLENAVATAKKLKIPARVHIEVETGMNRTGMDENQLSQLCDKLILEAKHLRRSGICTHLAGAESIANYYRIKKAKNPVSTLPETLQKLGYTF